MLASVFAGTVRSYCEVTCDSVIRYICSPTHPTTKPNSFLTTPALFQTSFTLNSKHTRVLDFITTQFSLNSLSSKQGGVQIIPNVSLNSKS